MMRSDAEQQQLRELWARVELELRAGLDLVRERLTAEDIRWVEEFLDHNELGLAFDVLIEALDDREFSREAYDHLTRAYGEMNTTEAADVWLRIQARFATG